jgi:hypothetical protein
MKIALQKVEPAKILSVAGILIITWLSFTFIFATVFFLVGSSLSSISLILSTLCSILIGIFLSRKVLPCSIAETSLAFLLWIASLGICLGVSAAIFDNSWDGQDYQQRAILQIANGFNPIYDIARPDEYYNRALNYYPKAAWVISASLYQATGNIETGKAVNSLLLVAGFSILCAIFLDLNKFKPWLAALLAALIVGNPVAIVQVFTYYIDGIVATLLTLFLMAIYIYLFKHKKLGFYLMDIIILLGVNIKFTGTAYFVIFALTAMIFQWAMDPNKLRIPSISWAVLTGFVFGMLVFGVSPYGINTIQHQNPFYPIYGGNDAVNKSFIMLNQYPADFTHMGKLETFARSLFSKSYNAYGTEKSELKIPFTITETELKSSISPDVRVAGFGPFFGGILLISVIGLVRGCQMKKSYPNWMIYLILGGLVFSVFINEESWWARYVPQLWLIPCLVVLMAANARGKVIKISSVLLCFFMALNLITVAGPNIAYNIKMSQKIDTVLTELSKSGETTLVYLAPFQPWTVKLDRYKIPYHIVSSIDELPCPEALQLISYSKADCH